MHLSDPGEGGDARGLDICVWCVLFRAALVIVASDNLLPSYFSGVRASPGYI